MSITKQKKKKSKKKKRVKKARLTAANCDRHDLYERWDSSNRP